MQIQVHRYKRYKQQRDKWKRQSSPYYYYGKSLLLLLVSKVTCADVTLLKNVKIDESVGNHRAMVLQNIPLY